MPIRGRVVKRVFEKSPKGDVYKGLLRKVRWGKTYEYKLIKRSHWIDEETLEKIAQEVSKNRVITPTYLAEKFDIKVSTARKLLRSLVEKGVLKEIKDVSDNQLRIYVNASK